MLDRAGAILPLARLCNHSDMPTETEATVIDLIVKVMDLQPEEVRLSSRLFEDLGIDGDDAIALFEQIQKRFGTDLTHLCWREHFGPEGMPLWTILPIFPAALVGAFVARAVGNIAGVVTTFALAIVAVWVITRLTSEKLKPITVAEVVQAVEAGSWPRST